MSAALQAVEARRVTARALESLLPTLPAERPIRLVAAGKAAAGMAEAVTAALGGRVVEGLVTVPDVGRPHDAPAREVPDLPHGLHVVSASHPEPDAGSEQAGRLALALADATVRDEGLLLVCLSGGASAMLAVPAPGLSTADKARTTAMLLRAGLPIEEVNRVRRHLSAIKGGQLAARARRTLTLAISDVVGDDDLQARTIGSGPTVGDPSRREDALRVIEAHGLKEALPAAVMAHLRGAATPDAGPVDPADPRLRESAYWVIASRHDAMAAAAALARRLGYTTAVLPTPLSGPAREGWRAAVGVVGAMSRPACVVASGETTVRVAGDGRGGRNQELAVSALEALADLAPAALASVGTDGIDGPTDAAGAIVSGSMWHVLGTDARRICDDTLARHDSYPLLDSLGALVRTGPTGTNVGDLAVLLTARGEDAR